MKQQFEFLKCMLRSKVRDEKGATMVEYALMAALIAAVCVGTITLIGTSADATFQTINGAL